MRSGIVVPMLIGLGLASGCSDAIPTQPALAGSGGANLSVGAPKNSEQVVFSGVAFLASSFSNGTPAGFWIWCEADSQNPYQGRCSGAMSS